jgi:hypothetical protein
VCAWKTCLFPTRRRKQKHSSGKPAQPKSLHPPRIEAGLKQQTQPHIEVSGGVLLARPTSMCAPIHKDTSQFALDNTLCWSVVHNGSVLHRSVFSDCVRHIGRYVERNASSTRLCVFYSECPQSKVRSSLVNEETGFTWSHCSGHHGCTYNHWKRYLGQKYHTTALASHLYVYNGCGS